MNHEEETTVIHVAKSPVDRVAFGASERGVLDDTVERGVVEEIESKDVLGVGNPARLGEIHADRPAAEGRGGAPEGRSFDGTGRSKEPVRR